jgi:hypothetical protein
VNAGYEEQQKGTFFEHVITERSRLPVHSRMDKPARKAARGGGGGGARREAAPEGALAVVAAAVGGGGIGFPPDLAIEILLAIFLALNGMDPRSLLICVPQVCRRWRDVCKAMLVVDVDVRWAATGPSYDRTFPLTDGAVLTLVSQFHSVGSRVNLSYCKQLTDVGVETVVGTSHSNIAWLDLTGCKGVMDAGLEKIAAGCPSLASLTLDNCCNVTERPTDGHLCRGGFHVLSLSSRQASAGA